MSNKTNKKGIALSFAIALISGIVFLVVVLFIILKQTGLLALVMQTFLKFLCTAGSYGRGFLVQIIMMFWKVVSIILTIVLTIVSIKRASNYASSIKGLTEAEAAGFFIKQAIKNLAASGAAFGAALGLLSVTMLLSYFLFYGLVGNIPLTCGVMTIDSGGPNAPIDPQTFLTQFSGLTIDCWDMYGGGRYDPIIGLDPPNPRSCFIVETYIDQTILTDDYGKSRLDMEMVYDYMEENLTVVPFNFEGGSENIYLFCKPTGEVDYRQVDFEEWNKCEFSQARIFIMYFDKHDYDLTAYGTTVCGGKPGDAAKSYLYGLIGGGMGRDATVICIEPI